MLSGSIPGTLVRPPTCHLMLILGQTKTGPSSSPLPSLPASSTLSSFPSSPDEPRVMAVRYVGPEGEIRASCRFPFSVAEKSRVLHRGESGLVSCAKASQDPGTPRSAKPDFYWLIGVEKIGTLSRFPTWSILRTDKLLYERCIGPWLRVGCWKLHHKGRELLRGPPKQGV
jgi:hypothetical protein